MTSDLLFESRWEVAGIRAGEEFFRILPDLLPDPAYLVFEGTSIAPDVDQLFQSAAVPPRQSIPAGTARPRPATDQVPASATFLDALADLAARHAEPELCDHFHAYDDARWLLQWYDAFDGSLLVDRTVGQDAVQRMCDALGATSERRP